jgi:hypothetical protein
MTEEQFLAAIDKAEERLNLSGQPRVIVFHEKGDHRDRHAHAVWLRIDSNEMKAIPMPFNKLRMREISRELFVEHGHEVPRGLINRDERNPLNYTFDQYQHAKRVGKDARQVKSDLIDTWGVSDDVKSLTHALQDKGFKLARGDRRGFVAVDMDGEVYSLPKWLGIKTKLIRDRIGKEHDLPSLDETKIQIGLDMLGKMDEHQAEFKQRNDERKENRTFQRRALVQRQREERTALFDAIQTRQIQEAKLRQAKFRSGLSGLWDWMRGENKRIKSENETEAKQAAERDRIERETIVQKQRNQRKLLAERLRNQAERMQAQHQQISADQGHYRELSAKSNDERREAFKRQRRQTLERYSHDQRNRGPEIDL